MAAEYGLILGARYEKHDQFADKIQVRAFAVSLHEGTSSISLFQAQDPVQSNHDYTVKFALTHSADPDGEYVTGRGSESAWFDRNEKGILTVEFYAQADFSGDPIDTITMSVTSQQPPDYKIAVFKAGGDEVDIVDESVQIADV